MKRARRSLSGPLMHADDYTLTTEPLDLFSPPVGPDLIPLGKP